MDKHEFNIKVEQIKKMVARSDFETAMKIADTIDWRRVRSINILSMAATIYEKNEEYREAKDILLLAFEQSPIGKRLLYKLAELAAKEGSLKEAEDYYREFCVQSPDDPRQYILRYLILGAKGAPAQQLIHTLEQYCNLDLDEKWLYELAKLYSEAGMDDLCIMACDKIMLMFGLGKYVDKAMELKIQLAPLTKYQMDLVENRDKYEAKLKAVEQGYHMGGSVEYQASDVLNEEAPGIYQESFDRVHEETAYTREPEASPRRELYKDGYQNEYDESNGYEAEGWAQEEAAGAQVMIEPEMDQEASMWSESESVPTPDMSDEVLKARIREAEAQANLAKEMSRLSEGDGFHQEVEMAQTRVLTDIRGMKRGGTALTACHFMIEAEVPEQGLKKAVEILKKLHRERGSKNQAARITGQRLNLKGVQEVSDKLAGKDLIIEQAGMMTESTLQDLNQLMDRDETGMNVVLIDTPGSLQEMGQNYPGFTKQFEFAGAEEGNEPKEDNRPVSHLEIKREATGRAILSKEEGSRAEESAIPSREEPDPIKDISQPQASAAPAAQRNQESSFRPHQSSPLNRGGSHHKGSEEKLPSTEIPSDPEEEYPEDQAEMDIDEFAKYACKYADGIDCTISGKSMLALYERIEIMEEDGILLTKENAEALIEEAADMAENPSFVKRLTGIFSSKYDKEGLLILKEEHFI